MAAFGEYKTTGKEAVVVYFKIVPSIRLNWLQDTKKNLIIFGVSWCSAWSRLEQKPNIFANLLRTILLDNHIQESKILYDLMTSPFSFNATSASNYFSS